MKKARVDKYSNDRLRARKAKILQEARHLIGSKGIDGLTMRELADNSGVALATLYNIYGSKDVLVGHAVNDFFENILEIRPGKLKDQSALDRMLTLLDLIASYVKKSAAYVRVVTALYFRLERDQDMHGMLYKLAYTELIGLLAELRRDAQFRDWVSLDLLADEMAEQIMWRILQWARNSVPDSHLADSLRFGVLQILVGASRGPVADLLQTHLQKSTRKLVKLRESNRG